MDTKNITFINELDPKTDEYTLKLCIIRLWRQPMRANPEKTYSIEMILMDEQGSKIQGNVLNRLFDKFEHFLEQGSVLYVYRPNLCEHQSKYKYIKHPYKLNFVFPTRVKKCNDFTRSIYGLDFASYQSIIDGAYDETDHFDIIGDVCKVYELVNTSKDPNKPNWRYNMVIQNLEGVEMNMTLWGSMALQMDGYVKNQNNKRRVVVALQLAKARFFMGLPYVNNSWEISRLFINTDIDEINDFKKQLIESDKRQISSSQMTIVTTKTLSQEFLDGKFITFDEIMEISKVQSLIVLGTIICIDDKTPWFYEGCKHCKHKATKDSKVVDNPDGSGTVLENVTYICGNGKCKIRETEVVTRFKITLRVQDSAATVSLTLFDNDSRNLLRKSAETLVREAEESGDKYKLPADFDILINKRFAFKVEVTPYNIDNNYFVYGISKLTDNVEIIKELEKKLPVENGSQSESFNITNSEFPLETSKVVKDAASDTGGIAQPSSQVDSSTATSPYKSGKKHVDLSSTPPALKRKLIDVYDVEDLDLMSTSKTKNKEAGFDERMAGFEEKAYLIPKKEK